MYFFNARLRFKVPPITTPISGSIIAASAISPVDLQKRPFEKHAHLARRLLDPQLYMASVDPALDKETVAKLAAYPWFHGKDVPEYDSGEYASRTDWKKQHQEELISKWTRTVPTDKTAIGKAAQAAVEFQVKIGCDAILLAAPLTAITDQTLQAEVNWLEAGLEACSKLKIKLPAYATIALSEAVLHVSALSNPLLHALSSHVATRSELAGAYIVLEQSEPGSYFWTAKDPLRSLLVLVDDLYRGAGKRVVVNYLGTFGLIAKTVGAEIWSSGYFLNQRRFSLKAKMGIAHPRYHSLALAGDVGLREDLERINRAGLADKVMTPSNADAVLRAALARGRTPADVPEWKYTANNWTAAQKHYLEVVSNTGAALEQMSVPKRKTWTHDWLENAVQLVQVLRQQRLVTIGTDVDHQKVWLDVFEEWLSYAKQ